MRQRQNSQFFFLSTWLVSTLLALILSAIVSNEIDEIAENNLRQTGERLTNHLADASEFPMLSGQLHHLDSLAQQQLKTPGLSALLIQNRQKRPISVAGRIKIPDELLRKNIEKADFLLETEDWAFFGAPIFHHPQQIPHEEEALPIEPLEVIGYLYLQLDKSVLLAAPAKKHQQAFAWCISLYCLWLAFLHGQARYMERTRENYLKALQALGQGQTQIRLPETDGPPTQSLNYQFNQLAKQIAQIKASPSEQPTTIEAPVLKRDPVTDLLNPEAFQAQILHLRQEEENKPVHSSMIELTILNAAQIEARLGTKGWHVILHKFATFLSERVREDDLVARLGEDRFAMVMRRLHGPMMKNFLEDIKERIYRARFIHETEVVSLEVVAKTTGLTWQTSPAMPHHETNKDSERTLKG